MYEELRNSDFRARRRCSTCHSKAAFYCGGCSRLDDNGDPIALVVLCGPLTSRLCFHNHCRDVFSISPFNNNEIPPVVNNTPAVARATPARRRINNNNS
jgi:hypothetical protein